MNRPEGISPEAWEKAVKVWGDLRSIPSYEAEDTATIALAIQSSVEAERERLAQLAVDYAAGRMRQSQSAKEAKKRTEARDFESMSMAGTDLVFAIRKGA